MMISAVASIVFNGYEIEPLYEISSTVLFLACASARSDGQYVHDRAGGHTQEGGSHY